MATTASPKPRHRQPPPKTGTARPHAQRAALRALAVAHPFGPVQMKLTVGPAHDRFEAEADTVAERVMRMPDGEIAAAALASAGGARRSVQRMCATCAEEEAASLQRTPLADTFTRPHISRLSNFGGARSAFPSHSAALEQQDIEEEEPLQTKPAAGTASEVAPRVQAKIHALRGGGRPLSSAERGFFEPRFGYDFGQVRIHTGARSAALARAVSARAFTVGRDVVFGQGQDGSQTPGGKKLLAHELTHVVQQTGSGSFGASIDHTTSAIRVARQTLEPLPAPSSTEVQKDETWLVEQPSKYKETVIAKLSVGTSLGVLSRGTGMSFNLTIPDYQWWLVRVNDGPAAGKQGWVMRSLLSDTPPGQDRALPQPDQIDEETSVRTIQSLAGERITGDLSDLPQAILAYRRSKGQPTLGEMTLVDLEYMVTDLTKGNARDRDDNDKAIGLIIDWFGIDTSSVLAVHYDPAPERNKYPTGEPKTSWIEFEAGSLKVIKVGQAAFWPQPDRALTLANEIKLRLQQAPPGDLVPVQTILSPEEVEVATAYNNDAFSDPLAINVVQGTLGGRLADSFTGDTVQRIAELQRQKLASPPSGVVDDATMGVLINRLTESNSQNAAIRISMDRYNLDPGANFLEIYYVPNLNEGGHAGGEELGAGIVRIGPNAFNKAYPLRLVSTIAHELEHVRQQREGLARGDLNMKQFLSTGVELLAVGIPELDVEGFRANAYQALWFWENPEKKEDRATHEENWAKHWYDFVRVRAKVRSRRSEILPIFPDYDELLRKWDRWVSLEDNPMAPPVLPRRDR